MMKRVFFSAAILTAGLFALSIALPTVATVWMAVLFGGITAVLLLFNRKRGGWYSVCACFCLVMFGLLMMLGFRLDVGRMESTYVGTAQTVTATVTNEGKAIGNTSVLYEVRLDDRVAGHPAKIGLFVRDERSFSPGDRITVLVKFAEPDERYRIGNWAKGVYLTGSAERVEKRNDSDFSLDRGIYRIKKGIQSEIAENLPDEAGGLLLGFLTGDKSEMSEETKDGFLKCGLSHTVAVSGMHLSVIAATLSLLFSLFGLSKRAGHLAVFPFVLGYAAVSGFSESSVRALVMIGLIFAADFTHRRVDRLNILGMTVYGMLILNPGRIGSGSFLLSASSLCGILVFCPLFETALQRMKHRRLAKGLGLVLTPGVTSLAATVGTLPLVLMNYGGFSLISPLTNTLICPLVTVAISGGMLAVGLGWILPLPFVFQPLEWILNLIRFLAVEMGNIPYGYLTVSEIGFYIGLALWAAVWLIILFSPSGKKGRFHHDRNRITP